MSISPSSVAAALREQIAASPTSHVYAVVDGAQCVELAFEAHVQYGAPMYNLFMPDMQARLWNVAPYLIPLERSSGYMENWARRWGANSGVLLLTDADDATLYRHLRSIFVVQDEEKQEFFFRFYDPRVLSGFLPTCSTAQLAEFFGPVSRIIAEADRGEVLWLARRDKQALASTFVDLPTSASSTGSVPAGVEAAPAHAANGALH